MKITNIIFSILLFCSCANNHTNKGIEKYNDSFSTKSDTFSISKECIQKDTITPLGTEIKYIYRNGKYKISYGNKFYNRTYDSLYNCSFDSNDGLWDFVPKFKSETKNNLIFTNILWTSSGANPSPLEYYAIVFPKNKKDNPFQKEFFITCKDDYLVYGDAKNENIHIVNLETKKTQLINLKPKPDLSRSPTLSIQETKIEKKVFFIKYESVDINDEIIIVEKTFEIEI